MLVTYGTSTRVRRRGSDTLPIGLVYDAQHPRVRTPGQRGMR